MVSRTLRTVLITALAPAWEHPSGLASPDGILSSQAPRAGPGPMVLDRPGLSWVLQHCPESYPGMYCNAAQRGTPSRDGVHPGVNEDALTLVISGYPSLRRRCRSFFSLMHSQPAQLAGSTSSLQKFSILLYLRLFLVAGCNTLRTVNSAVRGCTRRVHASLLPG